MYTVRTLRIFIATAFSVCFLLLINQNLRAQNANGGSIIGNWITSENKAKINIYQEKDGNYYGKIIWLKTSYDENGNPRRDVKNNNVKMRNRNLLGILILYNIKYNSNEKRWEDGKVYDPDMGHEASCIITLNSKNTIMVKGYVGFEWISKSETWEREEPK